MNSDQLLIGLILMTLGIVLIVALINVRHNEKRKQDRQATPLTRRSEDTRQREGINS